MLQDAIVKWDDGTPPDQDLRSNVAPEMDAEAGMAEDLQ
jgi:hypothetical protein